MAEQEQATNPDGQWRRRPGDLPRAGWVDLHGQGERLQDETLQGDRRLARIVLTMPATDATEAALPAPDGIFRATEQFCKAGLRETELRSETTEVETLHDYFLGACHW